MKRGGLRRKHTTITIPTPLFERMQEKIKKTGFSSVSDYATYILRETVADMELGRRKDRGAVIDKLKALGYTG
jgi:Arc/MetJ-type ribon-helix-helix transcriptional regulator